MQGAFERGELIKGKEMDVYLRGLLEEYENIGSGFPKILINIPRFNKSIIL